MKWLLLSFLKLYSRLISPVFHTLVGPMGGCRFTPGCGQYAAEAIEKHGPWRGSFLAIKRVCKCHPWHPGGHDPVPAKQARQKA